MKNLTPFIDDRGNMHVHGREGGVAVFEFQDEDGTPRNMSGASVFFEVKGFRKALQAGDTTSQMILIIERGDLNAYLNKTVDYVVLDETGTVPHVIIEGKLVVSGWV